ncbi:hypothetical protein IKB17_03315 [bacterium]|nr:hypothetical protein [bacterium]
MEISNKQIEALNSTVQILLPLQLKLPLAYQIACIARDVHEAFDKLNTERTEIITKYAKKDENGKVVTNSENHMIEIDDKDVKNVDKELNELFSKKVELKTEKIKLEDIKDLDLTVAQIEALVSFIEK